MCVLAGCEPGVRFNPTVAVEAEMKVWIACDEESVCYTAEPWEEVEISSVYPVTDLSDADWADYQEVAKRFEDWQWRLAAVR